jgi:hypothetical protein
MVRFALFALPASGGTDNSINAAAVTHVQQHLPVVQHL